MQGWRSNQDAIFFMYAVFSKFWSYLNKYSTNKLTFRIWSTDNWAHLA